MTIHWLIDKYNVLYPYDSAIKRIRVLIHATNIEELWKHYAEWKKPVKMAIYYVIPLMCNIYEVDYWLRPGGWEGWGVSESKWGVTAKEHGVSFWDGEVVLQLTGDSYIFWIYEKPLNCTL